MPISSLIGGARWGHKYHCQEGAAETQRVEAGGKMKKGREELSQPPFFKLSQEVQVDVWKLGATRKKENRAHKNKMRVSKGKERQVGRGGRGSRAAASWKVGREQGRCCGMQPQGDNLYTGHHRGTIQSVSLHTGGEPQKTREYFGPGFEAKEEESGGKKGRDSMLW